MSLCGLAARTTKLRESSPNHQSLCVPQLTPRSADATIANKATGAMSYAFISAIKANPEQSYVELLNSVRDILEEKYSQKPQLSCSHPLGKRSQSSRKMTAGANNFPDTDLLFVM